MMSTGVTISGERQWEEIAKIFKQWMERDDYSSELLRRTPIKSDWTVLDIGCETSKIAIASAIRAKSVTVLDISSTMLHALKSEADKKFLLNIRYMHALLETVKIGSDLKPHDLVIASQLLFRTGDVRERLQLIDQLTLRYAYVIAWGGKDSGFNKELWLALNEDDKNTSDYFYLFLTLHRMGITPNVEHIESKVPLRYPTLDEAIFYYRTLFTISPRKLGILEEFLKTHLVPGEDGSYEVPGPRPYWSLIWWKK